MTDNIVLELRNVCKEFKTAGFAGLATSSLSVLQNLSLAVYEGETLVVQGDSGAGKSTLARCILGRERIQGGSIRSAWGTISEVGVGGGIRAGRRKLSEREIHGRIQLVPQSTGNNVSPYESVQEMLTRTLACEAYKSSEAHNACERKLAEILHLSGLEPALLQRRVHELSGGQRQRILLARALCMDPKVIIFDEPVSNLDSPIQARIINTLMQLKAERSLSYMFITHDSDLARVIGDRIVRIEDGRIVET